MARCATDVHTSAAESACRTAPLLHRGSDVLRPLLCALLLGLPACASLDALEGLGAPDRPPWKRWSLSHGGIVPSEEGRDLLRRTEAALAPLRSGCACREVTIRVLASEAAAAYAWRDGSLFVTRGLLRVLDDAALTAAIAHELAHLSGHGDGLAGDAAERLADRRGSELLATSGLPRAWMLRMLSRLADEGTTPDPRLRRRWTALRDALPAGPVLPGTLHAAAE